MDLFDFRACNRPKYQHLKIEICVVLRISVRKMQMNARFSIQMSWMSQTQLKWHQFSKNLENVECKNVIKMTVEFASARNLRNGTVSSSLFSGAEALADVDHQV